MMIAPALALLFVVTSSLGALVPVTNQKYNVNGATYVGGYNVNNVFIDTEDTNGNPETPNVYVPGIIAIKQQGGQAGTITFNDNSRDPTTWKLRIEASVKLGFLGWTNLCNTLETLRPGTCTLDFCSTFQGSALGGDCKKLANGKSVNVADIMNQKISLPTLGWIKAFVNNDYIHLGACIIDANKNIPFCLGETQDLKIHAT